MKALNYFKKNSILVIASLVAVVTSFFNPPSLAYIDFISFKTLAIMFSFLIIVSGLISTRVFKVLAIKILSKVKTTRGLVLVLVFVPSFFATFITNNIAVLTFVPFIIVILTMCDLNHLILKTIILCTIGCNLGGLISPIANNQNLFLFAYFDLDIFYLVKNDVYVFLLSTLLLLVCCLTTKKEPITTFATDKQSLRLKRLIIYSILLVLAVSAVMVTLSYYYWIVLGIVIVAFLIVDKKQFKRVKYSILFTFVAFFIFTGNLRSIETVSEVLVSALQGNEYFAAVIFSQGISNTPATLLLSGFTDNVYPLIYGLNVGKNGTFFASMSGIFIHKIYTDFDNNQAKFFLVFGLYSLLFLVFMTAIGYFILF